MSIRRADIEDLLYAALPALATAYLAFNAGGFYPEQTGMVAVLIAVLIAARAALSKRPFAGLSAPLAVAVVALGGYAAWALLSANWSDSLARALPEYSRDLLYPLMLLFFGLGGFSARRLRWMLYAFVTTIVVVCTFGVIARTLPHVIFDSALVEEDRLGYPLTYWNALGALAGVGVVLCGYLACSTRNPWPWRIAGAASVPMLTVTLYYTLSRGATWATLVAVVAFVLIARPRGLIQGALATAPATLIVLFAANPPDVLQRGYPDGVAAIAQGKHVFTVMIACVVGAGLLRAALLPLDSRVERMRLPDRSRLPVVAGAVAVGLIAVVVGALAFHVPSTVSAKANEFSAKNEENVGGGGGRLLSANANGRKEHWEIALDTYHREPLHGSGADTFGLEWAKGRNGVVHVQDAHSLYIETLGELGLVGFILLVVALLAVLGAFVWRARGPDRALFAALFAAGLCWAISAGVDWEWEMPAVTMWLFAFGGVALARRPRAEGESSALLIPARALVAVVFLVLAVIPAKVSVSAAHFNKSVDAFYAGECPRAKAQAREALDASGERAAPYVVIAICDMREGLYPAAQYAMSQAHRKDPHNWEWIYDLAVTQAATGRNSYRTAKLAVKLNPNDENVGVEPIRFGPANRGQWVQLARKTPLYPPGQGDP